MQGILVGCFVSILETGCIGGYADMGSRQVDAKRCSGFPNTGRRVNLFIERRFKPVIPNGQKAWRMRMMTYSEDQRLHAWRQEPEDAG
ncbi:hypothetical protein [Desulfatiglans anilini]|uniref:hypothetical protein n=1 Tax=Desulfatiglans anilini TaxID=90728 RepID=UPI0004850B4D|nr:hypothetical protein [Desulfatiglans anilini]